LDTCGKRREPLRALRAVVVRAAPPLDNRGCSTVSGAKAVPNLAGLWAEFEEGALLSVFCYEIRTKWGHTNSRRMFRRPRIIRAES
jgi:hypothetical protein